MDLSINRLISGTISLFSSPMSEPTKFVAVALAALTLLTTSFYLLWRSCWKSRIKEIQNEPGFELGEDVIDLDGDSFIIRDEFANEPSTPIKGNASEDQIQRLMTSVSKKKNINPISQEAGINGRGEPFVKFHFQTPAARNRAVAELRGKEAINLEADHTTTLLLVITPHPQTSGKITGFVGGKKVQKRLDLE